MAKLGLVTVLYKSDEVLPGFFKSLTSQTFKDYHLYVIDNSSNNATNTLLERLLAEFPIPNYTYIDSGYNCGVAEGNNIGTKLALEAGCEYILLLNNDIEFHQHVLFEELYEYAMNSKETMLIPKILYYGTNIIWMAGGKYFKYKASTIHNYENMPDDPLKHSEMQTYSNYAPTCFMLIHRRVFDEVGFFDSKYFVYYDDTDFIYRAIQKGFKIFCLPHLAVYHKISSSTGGNRSDFTIYYTYRNQIYFIRKNIKGFAKFCSYTFMFSKALIKLFVFKREQKKSILKGIKEGLEMNQN